MVQKDPPHEASRAQLLIHGSWTGNRNPQRICRRHHFLLRPGQVQIASLGSFSNGLEDLPSGLQHVRVDYSKDRPDTSRPHKWHYKRSIINSIYINAFSC